MKKLFTICVMLVLLLPGAIARGGGEVRADSKGIDISEARLVYFVGDTFDYGSVKLLYDGFEIPSSYLTVEGFSSNTVGSRMVKLSYRDISVSYTITVFQKVKEIRLISVTHKTAYFTDEVLTVAGMKIQLIYVNDDTKNINVEKDWIKGFDSSAPTEKQTLTIDFGGVTTSFDIKIRAIEFPEKNYEEITLSEEETEKLKAAENRVEKTTLIIAWAGSLAGLCACASYLIVQYKRRGSQ